MSRPKGECPTCGRIVAVKSNGLLSKHPVPARLGAAFFDGDPCPSGGVEKPLRIIEEKGREALDG